MAANELLQRSLSPANRLRSPESSTAATGPLKTVAGGSANLISEFESEGHGPARNGHSGVLHESGQSPPGADATGGITSQECAETVGPVVC